MFNNIKVGDTFYNVTIEGLKENEVGNVFQELARKNNVQFEIRMNHINGKKEIVYEVINPSKKFLNKEGQWSRSISKKAEEFIVNM